MNYDGDTVKQWAGGSRWHADLVWFRKLGYSRWISEGCWAMTACIQKVLANDRPRLSWLTICAVLTLSIHGSCHASDADGGNRITVVFRYDDFSASSPTALETKVIEVFRRSGVAVTFGVIPSVGEGYVGAAPSSGLLPLTPEKAAILREAVEGGRFEVAQHGFSHQARAEGQLTEFVGLPRVEQQQRITAGMRVLENGLGVHPRTFIPPWNSYDDVTLSVAEEIGFQTWSARWECVPAGDSRLRFLPCTASLPELRTAVAAARRFRDGHTAVVVLFHPYDFVEVDKVRGVATLAQLTDLVDWVAAQSDLVTRTFSEAADADDTLTPARYRRWQGAVRDPVPLLLPPQLRTIINFYSDVSTLDHIHATYVRDLVVVHFALFLTSCVVGFLAARRWQSRLGTRTGAMTIGGVTLVATVVVLAAGADHIGWKRLMVMSFLLGFAVGVWVRYASASRKGSVGMTAAVPTEETAP